MITKLTDPAKITPARPLKTSVLGTLNVLTAMRPWSLVSYSAGTVEINSRIRIISCYTGKTHTRFQLVKI